MYSYGLKISRDEDLVNDAIQEVFIQLIRKRKKIKITSRIQVYLFKSLRNKLFEEYRSKNRKLHILEGISDVKRDFEPNAEQVLIDSESEQKIKSTLGKLVESLPARQKEIVYLKFTENLSYEEISELLQIDYDSARKLLYRSLKTLKEQLSRKILLLYMITVTSYQKRIPSF
jgi:RNA polymerase sigma factor (sigma-70 family)